MFYDFSVFQIENFRKELKKEQKEYIHLLRLPSIKKSEG
jgi:hypothetical protein